MSPLNIYKASAGSGKTFAITLEYLKLLFQSPGIHRNILAVTFTNKAAGEMKARILNLLFDLSKYDGSRRQEEMRLLSAALQMDETSIRKRSGELLQIILNDYTGFSVGSIDKFFQSVMRAFTREIGIQPGYNLELVALSAGGRYSATGAPWGRPGGRSCATSWWRTGSSPVWG